MKKVALTLAVLSALGADAVAQRGGRNSDRIRGFRPVATFGVPDGIAEIVAATGDGRTVLYSNASGQKIGVVDISRKSRPQQVADIAVNGEPTSVAVCGNIAVAAVWVDLPSEGSPPPSFAPGSLVVIDVQDPQNPSVLGSVDIGFHPDGVQLVERNGQLVAIVAIENQPVVVENGVVTDDEDPGNPNDISPAGLVQVVTLDLANPSNSTVADVLLPVADMTAAGLEYPADPQPEFVAVHENTAAVSLQENNGIAIIDFSSPSNPTLTRVFSTGVVANRAADLTEDDAIALVETYPADVDGVLHEISTDGGGNLVTPGMRCADSIAFHPDGTTIYTMDEGEMNYTGGRGVSAFGVDGAFVWDDAGQLERLAVAFSHYPEGRSENKGIEMEGGTVAAFGRQAFGFFLCERGSFCAIYDVTRADRPRFVQLLPTGISPEGVVAIPQRNLVVTADEVSGTLTIIEAIDEPYEPDEDQPVLFSLRDSWAAISGLTAAPWGGMLFAVPDNAMPTQIYAIRTGDEYAPVRVLLDVTVDGEQARYDGEGIALDTSILGRGRFIRGFWLCSEGNGRSQPNLLVQTDFRGRVLREIQLPNSIDAGADPSLPGTAQGPAGGMRIRSNGFEGVCLSNDGRYVYAAIQRDFTNEFPTGDRYARIARYDLQQLRGPNPPVSGIRCGGDWEFFYVRLDSNDGDNWAGLSELTMLEDGDMLIIERDKGIGLGSQLKKVYRISIDGLTPDADGVPDASDTVTKTEVRDVLADFFPYEKIEGLAVDRRGDLWVGLDNDGGEVEPRLVNTGRLRGGRGRRGGRDD